MGTLKNLFRRPKKEEEEENWWEKPDAPPEKTPSPEELIKQIERMRLAQRGIPKAIIFKQFIALLFIIINGAVLYTSIGQPLGMWIYLYTIPSIIILLDYLFTIRTLRKLAEGEEK